MCCVSRVVNGWNRVLVVKRSCSAGGPKYEALRCKEHGNTRAKGRNYRTTRASVSSSVSKLALVLFQKAVNHRLGRRELHQLCSLFPENKVEPLSGLSRHSGDFINSAAQNGAKCHPLAMICDNINTCPRLLSDAYGTLIRTSVQNVHAALYQRLQHCSCCE